MIITGTGFGQGATVTLNGAAATSVVVVDQTTITCVTAAHATAIVDVVVTNLDGGVGTLTDGYRYAPPVWADTPLTNDDVPPDETDLGPDTDLISQEADPDDVWREITDPIPPAPLYATPAEGVSTGGTRVFIHGLNFVRNATVVFGGVTVTATVINARTLWFFAPVHAIGLVSVTVTNPDLQTGTFADIFEYISPPPIIIDTVPSPASGTTAGGTTVLINGRNFQAAAEVTFGNLAATVTFVNSHQLSCVTPEHTKGLVNIRVTNPT